MAGDALERNTTWAAKPSARVLVVGYGSPIRGDDAVGPLVAERLEHDGVPDGVSVLTRHILTPDLIPEVCAADLVVFVDASIDGVPGEVHCRCLMPSPGPPVTVAHFLDPPELLAWTEALYDRRPRAFLVSTPGQCFDFGHFQLSEAVAALVPALADRVRQILAEASSQSGLGTT